MTERPRGAALTSAAFAARVPFMGTPLTLERCAEMRAEMEAGRLREEVLTQAGITSEDWTDSQRGWLEKMGAELERSRFELTNRYSQAYLERQRALTAVATPAVVVEAQRPPETAPLPLIALPPISPPPVAPPPTQPSPLAAAAPSPWAAPLPATVPPSAHAPQAASHETAMPTASPLRPPLPFRPAAAAPSHVAAQIPPAPPSRPEMPVPRPPSANLGATTAAAISPFAAVLPFGPDAASSPIPVNVPTLPKPAAPPLARPAVLPKATPPPRIVTSPAPAAAPMLDGTVMGAISPFGPTLPFASAPAPAPVPAPIPPPRTSAPGLAAPAVPESLTLEQHASLCAEIAFNPAHTDRTLGVYRVSPERKAELDQHWQGRLAAEPALGVKWREAYQLYFAFLSSARRR